MIRTLLVIASAAAFAGAANAQDMHVSIAGKSDAAIRMEMGKAAKLVCQDVSAYDYAPCVTESYRLAMNQVAKIKASTK